MLIVLGILFKYKIFFIQKRTGKKGKIFSIYKLKTMRDSIESDENRITKWGKILRRFSLDEIPQLWNVMKGDMSFVGPRPLLPEYLPLYSQNQIMRHQVKPGITGWSQVSGRNELTWRQQLEKDVYYVENQSFRLDLKILVKTVFRIFADQSETQTREAFNGKN